MTLAFEQPGRDFEFRNIPEYGRYNLASARALGYNYKFLEYSYIRNKLEERSDLFRYYLECLVTAHTWAFFILLFSIPSVVFVSLYFRRKKSDPGKETDQDFF